MGRSVSAWGFWADVLNSPYHAFGTACEQPEFYRITNKQFVRTAVDVAEHNIAVGGGESGEGGEGEGARTRAYAGEECGMGLWENDPTMSSAGPEQHVSTQGAHTLERNGTRHLAPSPSSPF